MVPTNSLVVSISYLFLHEYARACLRCCMCASDSYYVFLTTDKIHKARWFNSSIQGCRPILEWATTRSASSAQPHRQATQPGKARHVLPEYKTTTGWSCKRKRLRQHFITYHNNVYTMEWQHIRPRWLYVRQTFCCNSVSSDLNQCIVDSQATTDQKCLFLQNQQWTQLLCTVLRHSTRTVSYRISPFG